MAGTSLSLCNHIASLSHFLSHPLVSTLITFHPNNLGESTFKPPPEWEGWWDWAGQVQNGGGTEKHESWLLLLKYYESCLSGHTPSKQASSVPLVLRSLIDDACNLALSRDVGHVYPRGSSPVYPPRDPKKFDLPGMSPKKAHEVAQMADCLQSLMSSGSSLSGVRHVVDVGAGQAYLSRMLRDQFNLHVLALDWSEVQSQGAARKDMAKHCPGSENGSLTYVTTTINSQSLASSTTAWLQNIRPWPPINHLSATQEPMPVLFVALHACGSLTPDILRAFLSARKPGPPSTSTSWKPQGAIIVGCCYNMMRPKDFPLSQTLRCSSLDSSWVSLSLGHLQLAAQVPSQWTRSPHTLKVARLALRKIVWRALLEDTIKTRLSIGGLKTDVDDESATGTQSPLKRIGRLSDAAYADWETFIRAVRAKLGSQHVEFPTAPSSQKRWRVEIFHVLRCILGPVVESYILLDRLAWISEELNESQMTVELVNLFDQASGSGRNIAIMIVPK